MEHTHSTHNPHQKSQQPHIRAISEKLQREVDLILESVDEKTLFAEFREDEVFTIQKGDEEQVIHHTLDDRILMNRQYPKETTFMRIDRTTTQTAQKLGRWARMVNYLFKPLQY